MGSLTPSSITSNERLHYLDALRAFVMSIGVVLHASLIAGVHNWGATGGHGVFPSFQNEAVHHNQWIFPCASSRKDRRAKAVTKDRIRRLGVPILAFLLIFNPITIYIWNSREDNYPEMYFYIFNMPDPHLDTHGAGWHLHIWFLVVLFIYCICRLSP